MTEQEPKLFANQEALAGVRAQGPGQMPVLVKRPELMVAVRCETPSPLGCAILPLKAAPKKGEGSSWASILCSPSAVAFGWGRPPSGTALTDVAPVGLLISLDAVPESSSMA